MVMKNKLYKHHKSKNHMLVKNFSIVCASVLGIFGIIALPTYISINSQPQIQSKAATKVEEEIVEEIPTEEIEIVEEIQTEE